MDSLIERAKKELEAEEISQQLLELIDRNNKEDRMPKIDTGKVESFLPQKITKASTTSRIRAFVFGETKIGKSTWASQWPKPLFLATEPTLSHLDRYEVEIKSWGDFLRAGAAIVQEEHEFETIVVDTIDALYALCAQDICQKEDADYEGDIGSMGKGWWMVNRQLTEKIRKLAQLPYNLILISHTTQKEVTTVRGKYTQWTSNLPPKTKTALYSLCDLVLLATVETMIAEKGPEEQRVLKSGKSVNYETGSRFAIPDTLPLSYEALRNALNGNVEQA